MKVGDTLKLKPFLDADSGMVTPGAQECRVVYIHPQRRYFTVEFTFPQGAKFRQSSFFPEREGDMKASKAKNGPQNGRGVTNPRNLKRSRREALYGSFSAK